MIKPGRVHSNNLPSYLHHYCTKYGGLNRFGDPNFRIVWSGNEGEWKTSKFTDKDKYGDFLREVIDTRWVLKYRKARERERWIIEKWKDPNKLGTPEDWYAKRLIVDGQRFLTPKEPFPTRGIYKGIDVVEHINEHGEACYLEPTEAYIKFVIDCANYIDRLRADDDERSVTDANRKEKEDSIEKMVLKMKERNRVFYGPTVGFGKSFSDKRDEGGRPLWNEGDLPYIRGKVGHQFTDEWALEMPENYI